MHARLTDAYYMLVSVCTVCITTCTEECLACVGILLLSGIHLVLQLPTTVQNGVIQHISSCGLLLQDNRNR